MIQASEYEDLLAHISGQKFVLEVILANIMFDHPSEETAIAFREEIKRVAKKAEAPADMTPEESQIALEVALRSSVVVASICDRAFERSLSFGQRVARVNANG